MSGSREGWDWVREACVYLGVPRRRWTHLCSALSHKSQSNTVIEFSPLLPSGFQELIEGGDWMSWRWLTWLLGINWGRRRKGKVSKQELETWTLAGGWESPSQPNSACHSKWKEMKGGNPTRRRIALRNLSQEYHNIAKEYQLAASVLLICVLIRYPWECLRLCFLYCPVAIIIQKN